MYPYFTSSCPVNFYLVDLAAFLFMKKIQTYILLSCIGLLIAFTAHAQEKKVETKSSKIQNSQVEPVAGLKKEPKKKFPVAPVVDNSIRIKITTDSGIIIVKLYDSTPLHRNNFVKLVSEHFYDSLLFHRVIPAFMIQGGDPTSKNAGPNEMLGNGGGDMVRIPAEFRPELIHKKGALAGARDNNPAKASSACQFYLVEGRTFTDQELNNIELRNGIKYSPEQREIYKTVGGTPFLDGNYTVFGEVESGLDVISKISHTPRNQNDRPLVDIRMYMEIIK